MLSFSIGVQVFFIVFSRVLGFFISSPFWNSSILFFRFRLLIVIMFSYILLPMAQNNLNLTVAFTMSTFWILILQNLLFGLLVGFSLFFLFSVFQIVGELWSFQMGFSINQVLDPTTGDQSAILAQMINFLALLVFVSIDGHMKILALIYDSFGAQNLFLENFSYSEFIKNLPQGLSILFIRALELSLTLVGSIFISTLFVGMLAKAAPQLNVFQFGMPVYVMIGFSLMIYLVPNFIAYTGNYIDTILREVQRWMLVSKGGA